MKLGSPVMGVHSACGNDAVTSMEPIGMIAWTVVPEVGGNGSFRYNVLAGKWIVPGKEKVVEIDGKSFKLCNNL